MSQVPGPNARRLDLSATKRALLERRLKGKGAVGAATGPASQMPARPDKLHATPAQQSVYTAYVTSDRSPAFHLVSAFRLRGAVDVEALRQSLADVVERHELLRSNYRLDGGRLEMRIRDRGTGAFFHRLVSELTVERTAVDRVVEPFDLEHDELIRLVLLHTSPSDSMLLSVTHDIVYDGWSVPIFWRELAAFYRLRARAEPHQLADLALQFADLAASQNFEQEKTLTGREADFWRARLSAVPPPIALPTDRTVPPRHDYRGALSRITTDRTLAGALKTFAQARGVTPFVVVLLAFFELLARYCGGREFLLAIPVANRAHPASRHLIGNFVATLPMALHPPATASVSDALNRLRDDLMAALDHRDIAMDQLLKLVDVPREAGRLPLVQVMLVYQNGDEGNPTLSLGDVEADHHRLDPGVAKFDLTLFVTDAPDGLQTLVEYRTTLFDASTMETLAERYRSVLQNLLERPDARLASIDYLSARDRLRLESLGAGPVSDTGVPIDVVTNVFDVARSMPDAVAVTSNSTSLTYRELTERAHAVACELMTFGIASGDRVGHYSGRDEHAIVGILGILRAGAAYVPIDPAYPAERRRLIAADADLEAWVSVSTLATECAGDGLPCVEVDRLDGHPAAEPPGPKLDATAYVIYTSGSTGRPKGVAVTHRNLCHSNHARTHYYRSNGEAFLLLSSFAFDSSMVGIFETLTTGGEIVVADEAAQRDPGILRQLIERRRVQALLTIPALYREILLAGDTPLPSLRRVIVAGEACGGDVVRLHFDRQPECALYNEYGPSEATVWATVHRCSPADALGAAPIGKPIANTRVLVLDEQRRVVAPGLPGELYIGGEGVAAGYIGRPTETEERFIRDENIDPAPLYRTGDRVFWDAPGTLRFLGRVDNQVKVRGHRVELAEVEAALLDVRGISAAAAAVLPQHDREDESYHLVAFVVTETDDPEFSDSALRRKLADFLPNPAIPNRFVRLPELPHLPNGKIDRNRLPHLTGAAVSGAPATRIDAQSFPRNRVELELLSLWQEVLGVDDIGVSDNYFDLGGTSFQAIQLFSAIESRLGEVLSPSILLQHPTIEALAGRLRTDPDGKGLKCLLPIRSRVGGAPLFCIHAGGGHVLFYRKLAEKLESNISVFALQPIGMNGEEPPSRSMSEMAARYIQEMKLVQPNGPYHVLGYCFGATAAFEIARQLLDAGDVVDSVIVIDSSGPVARGPLRRRVMRARLGLRWFIRLVRAVLSWGWPWIWRKIVSMTGHGFARVGRRLIRIARPEEVPDPVLRSDVDEEAQTRRILLTVQRACVDAFLDYQPVQLHCPVLFIRGRDSENWDHPYWERGLVEDWRKIAPAIEVETIDCIHVQFFESPHVEKLAKIVTDRVERATSAESRAA